MYLHKLQLKLPLLYQSVPILSVLLVSSFVALSFHLLLCTITHFVALVLKSEKLIDEKINEGGLTKFVKRNFMEISEMSH